MLRTERRGLWAIESRKPEGDTCSDLDQQSRSADTDSASRSDGYSMSLDIEPRCPASRPQGWEVKRGPGAKRHLFWTRLGKKDKLLNRKSWQDGNFTLHAKYYRLFGHSDDSEGFSNLPTWEGVRV